MLRRLRVVVLRMIAVIGVVSLGVAVVAYWSYIGQNSTFAAVNRAADLRNGLAEVRIAAADLKTNPTDATEKTSFAHAMDYFVALTNRVSKESIYDPVGPHMPAARSAARDFMADPTSASASDELRSVIAELDLAVASRTAYQTSVALDVQRRSLYALVEISLALLAACGVVGFLVYRPMHDEITGLESDAEADRERLRSLFELMPEGLVMCDRDGTISEVNDALLKILGQRRRTISGAPLRSLFAAEMSSQLDDPFARALEGAVVSFDALVVDIEGNRRDVRAILLPSMAGDEVIAIYAILRSVREIVVVERASAQAVATEVQSVAVLEPMTPAPTQADYDLRFRMLFDANFEGGVAFDSSGRVEYFNDAMVTLSGYAPGEIAALNLDRLFTTTGKDDIGSRFTAIAAGQGAEFDARLRCKDGAMRPVRVLALPFGKDQPGVAFFAKDTATDHAQRRRSNDQRERLRALSTLAAAHALDVDEQLDRTMEFCVRSLEVDAAVVNQIDADSGTAEVVRSAGAAAPHGQKFALSQTFSRHIFGRHRMLVIDDTDAGLWRNDFARRNEPWRSLIGTTLFVGERAFGTLVIGSRELRGSAFDSADIDFVQLVATLIGAALERAERDRELGQMAVTDNLTSLPNRAFLLEHLPRAVTSAQRGHTQLAVLYIDLDGFKPINDRFGHAAGDEVLQRISDRLREVVRGGDVVARVGGDEFVIVQTTNSGADDARRLADRITGVLAEAIEIESTSQYVGASIGVALYPDDGEDAEELLRNADAKMYRMKRARKRSAV